MYSSEINEYNMTITSSSLNFSFDISKLLDNIDFNNKDDILLYIQNQLIQGNLDYLISEIIENVK